MPRPKASAKAKKTKAALPKKKRSLAKRGLAGLGPCDASHRLIRCWTQVGHTTLIIMLDTEGPSFHHIKRLPILQANEVERSLKRL